MNLAGVGAMDLLGTVIGLVLTLLVFSYVIGDNSLFRFVLHIFIGVSAGYVAVVVWNNVIWPKLVVRMFGLAGMEYFWAVIPFVLSLLLFMKISPRYTAIGSPVMAFLVGVGAATAVGGAVLGLIFPQVLASVNLMDIGAISQNQQNVGLALANGSIILIGTICTLAYFHFGARRYAGRTKQRSAWIEPLAWIGEGFIAIAFGMIFAGVYAAALAALIERWSFITQFFLSMIAPFS